MAADAVLQGRNHQTVTGVFGQTSTKKPVSAAFTNVPAGGSLRLVLSVFTKMTGLREMGQRLEGCDAG